MKIYQITSKQNIYNWNKLFQHGRDDANDEPRSGRQEQNIFIWSDSEENCFVETHRIAIGEIAEDLRISVGSCYDICGTFF